MDKQGKTHFGDTVPNEYRDVARPVDIKVTATPPAELRRATEIAAREKARAAAADRAAKPAVSSASASAAPPPPSIAKRPANAPTEVTDCATWRRLYLESLDCFGPFRTARGATREQAFEFCTPVTEPPQRCGRNAQ